MIYVDDHGWAATNRYRRDCLRAEFLRRRTRSAHHRRHRILSVEASLSIVASCRGEADTS